MAFIFPVIMLSLFITAPPPDEDAPVVEASDGEREGVAVPAIVVVEDAVVVVAGVLLPEQPVNTSKSKATIKTENGLIFL
jgi:hypothetical protein